MIIAAHCIPDDANSDVADIGIVVIEDGQIVAQSSITMARGAGPHSAALMAERDFVATATVLGLAALEGGKVHTWTQQDIDWLVDVANRLGQWHPVIEPIQRPIWATPDAACKHWKIDDRTNGRAVSVARIVARVAAAELSRGIGA